MSRCDPCDRLQFTWKNKDLPAPALRAEDNLRNLRMEVRWLEER
jgi:hypothetical protein